MPSMHATSVATFSRMLTNLLALLAKAEAYATERGFSPDIFVTQRLAPDMYPLVSQIGIATDHAKGAAARLSGQAVPSWPDDEKTMGDLKQRLQKAIDFLATVSPAQVDGSEDRDVVLATRNGPLTLKGEEYLLKRALPNFFFHVTTAYDILRHNGVPIGKSDFIG